MGWSEVSKKNWGNLKPERVYSITYEEFNYRKQKGKNVDLKKATHILQYDAPKPIKDTLIVPRKVLQGIKPGDFQGINEAVEEYVKSVLGDEYSLDNNADAGLVSLTKFVYSKEGFTPQQYREITGFYMGVRHANLVMFEGHDGKIYTSSPMGNISAQNAVANGKEPFTRGCLLTGIQAKTSKTILLEPYVPIED